MAKQVKNSDLVQGKLWEPTIKETEALIDVLDKLEQQFKDVSKASAKASKEADVGTAKGIKTVNQELEKQKGAKQQLSAIDKQRERALERLRIAQSKEGLELEKTNQRIQRQRRANKALARETDELNTVYDRSSAKLNRLIQEYRKLEKQNGGTTREAKKLLREITFLDAKLKASDKTIGRSQRNVGNYSSAFKGLGGALGGVLGPIAGVAGAVAALGAGLTAAAGLFREFGLVSAKVQAVSGATAEEFAALQTQAKALGETTPFTASNVAQLQLELSKLGLTATEIGDATAGILNFAIATDTALDQTGKIVAQTINAFGLVASDSNRVADVLTAAFSGTALDINKFEVALSTVGATAKASGLTLEETTAVLGALVDAGIDASQAATGFRKVLAISAKENRDYKDVLAEIVGDTNQLSKANEIFGLTAQSQAVTIANNIEKVDELTVAFNNAEGAAEDAAAIIGDTLDGDIKKLQSAIQGAVLDNDGFNDVLRKIVQTLTRFVKPAFEFLTRTFSNLIDLFRPFKVIIEAIGDLFFEIAKAFGLSSDEAGAFADKISFILNPLELAAFFARFLADTLKELIEVIKIAGSALADFGRFIAKDFNDSINTVKSLAGSFGNLIGITNDLDGSISKQRVEQGKLKNAFDDTKGSADQLIDKFKETTFFTDLLNKSAAGVAKVFLDGFGFRKVGNDLINFLGEINKRLSTAEVEKQLAKRNLTVQELNDLISEQQELIKGTNTRVDAKRIQDIIALLEKQKEAILGGKESNDAVAGSIRALNEQISNEKKALDELQTTDAAGIRQKQEKIKALEDELEAILNVTEAVKALSEFEEEQIDVDETTAQTRLNVAIKRRDLLREINQAIADGDVEAREDAQKRLEELDAQVLQNQVDRLNKELENLQTNGREQFETEEEFQIAILNKKKEIADAETKIIQQSNSDQLKAVNDLQKQIQESTVASIDVLDQAFAKASENRINEIDREIVALQDREQALRDAANNGSKIAEENLATNQRLQAEQERAREEQVRKAQRREIVLAGLKAFAENAGQPDAVNKTLTDITTLSAALLNLLPSLYVGTEDTGKVGQGLDSNGGRLAVLHDNERVMTKEQNKLMGGVSNDIAAQIVHDHINPTHFDEAPIVQVQRFESNAAILQKFDELKQEVASMPSRMPRILEESFDEKSKVYKTVIKTGNKVEKNHKRIKGIWG